ncbi:1931_t:CDS:2, partial [Cetraspora pellucida]
YANSQDYTLVKKRTRKEHYGKLKNMTICCDRGGIYNDSLSPSKEIQHRQRSTKLINCLYELYTAQHNSQWHLELKTVAEMTAASSCYKEIVLTLYHNNTSMLIINKNIYNAHKQLCQQNYAGHTSIQMLDAYSTLKAYLQVLTEDLYQVRITISLVVANQKKEIDAMIALECIHILLFALNNLSYMNIRGKISSFTFKKINNQYQKANCATSQEPLPPCTGFFLKTIGLSYAHIISLLENN